MKMFANAIGHDQDRISKRIVQCLVVVFDDDRGRRRRACQVLVEPAVDGSVFCLEFAMSHLLRFLVADHVGTLLALRHFLGMFVQQDCQTQPNARLSDSKGEWRARLSYNSTEMNCSVTSNVLLIEPCATKGKRTHRRAVIQFLAAIQHDERERLALEDGQKQAGTFR